MLTVCTNYSGAEESPGLPNTGDCVIYREGGDGYVFKTPTWWVSGAISEIYTQKRLMDTCPLANKNKMLYTRDDWIKMTEAYPCVDSQEKARHVEVTRIRFKVKEWETPWVKTHGQNGRLYRGYYLDIPLKTGATIDIDGTLLEQCVDKL